MRVSKETAVLLKDARYDVACRHVYTQRNRLIILNYEESNFDGTENIVAPTLHEASDWLRSKGVHVGVECSDGIWACSGQKCPDGGMLFDLPFCYPTHESAYEAGIVHGLKYIIH